MAPTRPHFYRRNVAVQSCSARNPLRAGVAHTGPACKFGSWSPRSYERGYISLKKPARRGLPAQPMQLQGRAPLGRGKKVHWRARLRPTNSRTLLGLHKTLGDVEVGPHTEPKSVFEHPTPKASWCARDTNTCSAGCCSGGLCPPGFVLPHLRNRLAARMMGINARRSLNAATKVALSRFCQPPSCSPSGRSPRVR